MSALHISHDNRLHRACRSSGLWLRMRCSVLSSIFESVVPHYRKNTLEARQARVAAISRLSAYTARSKDVLFPEYDGNIQLLARFLSPLSGNRVWSSV